MSKMDIRKSPCDDCWKEKKGEYGCSYDAKLCARFRGWFAESFRTVKENLGVEGEEYDDRI